MLFFSTIKALKEGLYLIPMCVLSILGVNQWVIKVYWMGPNICILVLPYSQPHCHIKLISMSTKLPQTLLFTEWRVDVIYILK